MNTLSASKREKCIIKNDMHDNILKILQKIRIITSPKLKFCIKQKFDLN